MKKGIFILGLFIFILSLHAYAIPQTINFQGRLTSSDATPINTQKTVDFKLYDDIGTIIATSTESVTPNSNGAFSVLLSFNSSAFAGGDRWIGVTVGSDSEMTPRQKITAVPYAYRAITAESVVGGISGADIKDGTVSKVDLNLIQIVSGADVLSAGETKWIKVSNWDGTRQLLWGSANSQTSGGKISYRLGFDDSKGYCLVLTNDGTDQTDVWYGVWRLY